MDCSTPGFPVFTTSQSCSNSCLLSQWYHPSISSSATPFSSCPQSFLALGSFPMSWLFASGIQSIGVSASASALLMNIQGWFPLELTGLISLLSKGLSRVFSSTTIWKQMQFESKFHCSAFFMVQVSHPYMTTGKAIALTRQSFVGKVMSLLFNMLSRFATAFLPRSKHLLISWLQSPSAVILEPNVWREIYRYRYRYRYRYIDIDIYICVCVCV